MRYQHKNKVMKKFKKISIMHLLCNIFAIKVKVDSKQVRRIMNRFFHYNDWKYQYTITKVSVYETKNTLFVNIESHRPGLLIGKGGRTIDSLREWLEEEFKKEVKIRIEECQLWNKLYS